MSDCSGSKLIKMFSYKPITSKIHKSLHMSAQFSFLDCLNSVQSYFQLLKTIFLNDDYGNIQSNDLFKPVQPVTAEPGWNPNFFLLSKTFSSYSRLTETSIHFSPSFKVNFIKNRCQFFFLIVLLMN